MIYNLSAMRPGHRSVKRVQVHVCVCDTVCRVVALEDMPTATNEKKLNLESLISDK